MSTSDATKIAVLQKGQTDMASDLLEIKADIKEIKALITTNFVTQTEYQAYKQSNIRALENAKIANDTTVASAKKANLLSTVGYVLATAIVTALVYYFISTRFIR